MYLLFTLIRFDEAAAEWEEDDDDDDEACSSAFEDRLTFLSPSMLIPSQGEGCESWCPKYFEC